MATIRKQYRVGTMEEDRDGGITKGEGHEYIDTDIADLGFADVVEGVTALRRAPLRNLTDSRAVL